MGSCPIYAIYFLSRSRLVWGRSGEEEEAAQRGAVLTHWEICLLVLLWFFFYHQQPSLVGPALPQLELHCSALHCGSGYGLTRP